jgi:biopolymer transport protein ExbD
MNKIASGLCVLTLAILCLAALSCSSSKPAEAQKLENKKEIINLPGNMESGDKDIRMTKDTSMIIGVAGDKNIYQGTESISKEQLVEKLKKFAEGKSKDELVVYLKGDIDAAPGTIVDILKTIRDAKIYNVSLVVNKSSNPSPSVLEIVLPPAPSKEADQILKPNPTLLVVYDADGDKIKLNTEDAVSISDLTPLKTKLRDVFKDREKTGVFAEGTNEVEKSVFIRFSKLNKYGNIVKVVDALRAAGAQPIKWDIDEETNPKQLDIDDFIDKPVPPIKKPMKK